jgi:hypothetical protein
VLVIITWAPIAKCLWVASVQADNDALRGKVKSERRPRSQVLNRWVESPLAFFGTGVSASTSPPAREKMFVAGEQPPPKCCLRLFPVEGVDVGSSGIAEQQQ